jgi:hypothetical protein
VNAKLGLNAMGKTDIIQLIPALYEVENKLRVISAVNE